MAENESLPMKQTEKEEKRLPPRERMVAYIRQILPQSKEKKEKKVDENDCVACRVIGSSVTGVAGLFILLSSRRRKILYPNNLVMQGTYIFVCGCLSAALLSISVMVGFKFSFSEFKDCKTLEDYIKKDAEVGKKMRGKIARKIDEVFLSNGNTEKEEKDNINHSKS